jgi:hypothetical protein
MQFAVLVAAIVLGLVLFFLPDRVGADLIGRAFVGILGPAFALLYSLWEHLNQTAKDMNASGAGPVLPSLVQFAAWLLIPITIALTFVQNAQFPVIAGLVDHFRRSRSQPKEA